MLYTLNQRFFMGILDFFFPRKCLSCGRHGGYFCSDCLNLVSFNLERICPVCEKPSIGGQTHPRCQTKTSLDGLTSIFVYKGIIKKAIGKLKYQFVSDLATDLAEIFLSFCGEDKFLDDFCLKEKPILVPIPLYFRREKWRGFNQSAVLGKMIAENLGISFFPNLLVRIKDTKPQAKLKEKEREKNIKNVFNISPTFHLSPTNYSVLLFDDVWTTGATLKEATRVLKINGIRKVWGLTIAR